MRIESHRMLTLQMYCYRNLQINNQKHLINKNGSLQDIERIMLLILVLNLGEKNVHVGIIKLINKIEKKSYL